jgi:hypothetical protein
LLGIAVSSADEGITLLATKDDVAKTLWSPQNGLDGNQLFVVTTQKGIGAGDYE